MLQEGGRLRFVAPELSSGSERFRTNEASDVYSLAMTIYALGSGLVPFHDIKNEFAASRAAEAGNRPSTAQISNMVFLTGHAQAGIEELVIQITQMWDGNPDLRPSVAVIREEVLLSGLMLRPSLSSASTPFTSSATYPNDSHLRHAVTSNGALPIPNIKAMNRIIIPDQMALYDGAFREESGKSSPWYLMPGYGSEELRFNSEGAVETGTLRALVEWLTTPRPRTSLLVSSLRYETDSHIL